MSETPKQEVPRSLSKITPSETNALLDLVIQDLDLGLEPHEQSKLLELARSHVSLEPEVLRICESACPAHDICPLIRGIATNKRPYGHRCPMEAIRYRTEFENFVNYVKSMDTASEDEDPAIPAVEMGLCKDVAFMAIMEHRAKISLGIDPSATIDIVIPGARGATGKTDNPSFRVFSQISRDKKNQQQLLYKMAQDRLKRVERIKNERVHTLKELKEHFKDLKKVDASSALGKLLGETDSKINANDDSMLRALHADKGEEDEEVKEET